jgi:hypothetical protein
MPEKERRDSSESQTQRKMMDEWPGKNSNEKNSVGKGHFL